MNDVYAKAYTELYEILKNISEKDLNKIPKEVLDMLEEKRDKEYNFKLEENIEFENQKLLRETKILLAILYRDYWATKEEKEKITQKWKNDIIKNEEENKIKYNELFKNKKQPIIDEENENNLPIEPKKEKLFEKIICFIKKYLKLQ